MNRIIMGTLLSVAMAGAAFAASAPAATSSKPTTPMAAPAAAPATIPAPAAVPVSTPDYATQCASLAGQWTTAADANKTNKKFALAKSGATKGGRNCKSTKAAAQKKGVAQYEAALKLLGVTATP